MPSLDNPIALTTSVRYGELKISGNFRDLLIHASNYFYPSDNQRKEKETGEYGFYSLPYSPIHYSVEDCKSIIRRYGKFYKFHFYFAEASGTCNIYALWTEEE